MYQAVLQTNANPNFRSPRMSLHVTRDKGRAPRRSLASPDIVRTAMDDKIRRDEVETLMLTKPDGFVTQCGVVSGPAPVRARPFYEVAEAGRYCDERHSWPAQRERLRMIMCCP